MCACKNIAYYKRNVTPPLILKTNRTLKSAGMTHNTCVRIRQRKVKLEVENSHSTCISFVLYICVSYIHVCICTYRNLMNVQEQ